MPAKRALAETNANEQPQPKKGRKTAAAADKNKDVAPGKENVEQGKKNKNKKESPKDKEPEFPPHEYCCMGRPFYDFEEENEDSEDDSEDEEQLDRDDLIEKYNAQIERGPPSERPLKDHPEEKWMCMWETWTKFCEYKIRAQYCDQDSFGMHIYNDFTGYGLQEVIENMFVEFDQIFTKAGKSDERLKQCWAMTAVIAHFLTQVPIEAWYMHDDSQQQCDTVRHIGTAFLTALNELDLAGQLKADSEFKDLSLVMAVYLSWSGGSEMSDLDSIDSCLEWRVHVVEYAKKAGIDLRQSVVRGLVKRLDEMEEEHDGGEIKALAGKASADRWKWKKAHKKFVSDQSTAGPWAKDAIGGDKYNIVKWSRAERKKYSFDGKDPLAGFTNAQLKSGGLMLA